MLRFLTAFRINQSRTPDTLRRAKETFCAHARTLSEQIAPGTDLEQSRRFWTKASPEFVRRFDDFANSQQRLRVVSAAFGADTGKEYLQIQLYPDMPPLALQKVIRAALQAALD